MQKPIAVILTPVETGSCSFVEKKIKQTREKDNCCSFRVSVSGKMCHLKVSVDDRRLALVQTRNSVTGVTEDLQHLSFSETSLQPLIHQIDHLTSCKIPSN